MSWADAGWWVTDDYDVGRIVVQRGIAFAYLVAFVNVRNQFRPLLGERGLLPVPMYLAGASWRDAPSIFQLAYSDRLLGAVAWTGMVLSAGALLGGFDAVPVWVAVAGWIVLWALYLSIVNVGQVFYGFGWESLLLEAGLCAALLGNATTATPVLAIAAARWLLFRVEFGAGMIKMRGDECWRDLTCLDFHHETQPLPGPTSRWFHLRPTWLHRVETGANHVAQLVAPWALLLPQPVAGIGAALMIVTQGYLLISGNYSWLNLVTLVLAFAAIPDGWFERIGIVVGGQPQRSTPFELMVLACAVGIVVLSRRPAENLFRSGQRMNFSWNRYHLVNSYGAFGSVTRRRREILVEGSDDGSEWRSYEFRGKPGDPSRRPRQVAPYHLRLDWMMWFLPLSPRYAGVWFDRLLDRLLDADPEVLALLAHDPFDGRRPAYVRARIGDYRFATRDEFRRTRQRWITGDARTFRAPLTR